MLLERMRIASIAVVVATIACSAGQSSKITAQTPAAGAASMSAGQHDSKGDDNLNWGPAPPIFPKGAEFAVVQGDPSVAGEIFTVRLRFPNGYIIPPHRHPTAHGAGGRFRRQLEFPRALRRSARRDAPSREPLRRTTRARASCLRRAGR